MSRKDMPPGTRGGARVRYHLRSKFMSVKSTKAEQRASELLSIGFSPGEESHRILKTDRNTFKNFEKPIGLTVPLCEDQPGGVFNFNRTHQKWSALKGGPIA